MKPALTICVLAIFWAAITGTFTGLNLLFGAGIGTVVVTLLRRDLERRATWRRVRNVLSLAVLFLYELMVSAIRVALVVLRPDMRAVLRPAIIAFPLSVKSDVEITVLANLITLTPGTLSVDVSQDRRLLYVHALTLDTREALIADIASGFEAKVREVFA